MVAYTEPRADSEFIRPLWVGTHVCESGYRGVYRHHSGRWRPRAKVDQHLRDVGPPCLTPSAAAMWVARWYLDRFGENWPAVLRQRRTQAWRIRWSERYGGYLIRVWEFGYPTELTWLNRWGKPLATLAVLQTRELAREYMRHWLRKRWGLFAELVLWRS